MPNGQFGDNQWNNPQMNQFNKGGQPPGPDWGLRQPPGGGYPQPGGGYPQPGYSGGSSGSGGGTPSAPSYYGGTHNPNSPNDEWMAGHTPDQAGWTAGTPGRLGQTPTWNPYTGEFQYVNSTEGLATGNRTGQLSWIDPVTGQRTINPAEFQSVFGMDGGQGGNQGYQNYQGSQYSGGDVTPGAGYGGYDYQQSSIDPSAVIAAQEYKLQEAMEGDMARAGGRAGQSGFAMSTPYANQLGEAARKASQDRNALTMQYQYDAAQAQANREQQQQLQDAQLGFGGWQTGYQGDLQSQMFNEGQNFQGWLAGEQMGMQNAQGRNQWNLAQQGMQQNQNNLNQQLMASLMGGLF